MTRVLPLIQPKPVRCATKRDCRCPDCRRRREQELEALIDGDLLLHEVPATITPEPSECARGEPDETMSLPLAIRPSVRLTRAPNATRSPFNMICKIVASVSQNEQQPGTGFLVGPSHVLTAAHVLYDKLGGRFAQPEEITVFVGLHGGHDVFDVETTNIHVFPGYHAGTQVTPCDLALIEIQMIGQLSNQFSYWGKPTTPNDADATSLGALAGWRPGTFTAQVSGYPGDSDFQHRSLDDTISFPAGGSTGAVRMQETTLLLRHRVLYGMSGSPVWVRRHPSMGGRIAIAIFLGMIAISKKRYVAARILTQDILNFVAAIQDRDI
jgi:V8-like Glu-specific endopeptidase